MKREYYLDLAASGLRTPIATDLVLHEKPDPERIRRDGRRLGEVLVETARRFRSPLAVPLMDLTIEKIVLAEALGILEADADTFHLAGSPADEEAERVRQFMARRATGKLHSAIEAIKVVAGQPDLLPMGMVIGPFSFVSKLLSDPITPIFLAGDGVAADEEDDIRTLDRAMELAMIVIESSIDAQLEAGAKAMFIAEPAASNAFISPLQIAAGSDVFDRYVMGNLRRLKARLDDRGADLIFHCCGELCEPMLRGYSSLDPAILSLGSSRCLWEDAAIVSKRTVLYGNLPSKKFYSDDLMSLERVRELADELIARMRVAGHPFILGSECDVLSVVGAEDHIKAKANLIAFG